MSGILKMEGLGSGMLKVFEAIMFGRPLQTSQIISSEPFSKNTVLGSDFQPKTAGGHKCAGNLWSMSHQ